MAFVPTITDIREISPVLSEKLNLDIYNYTLSFLRRRFSYIFEELNVKSLNAFVESLKDSNVVDEFYYLFCVPDTEMFRDPSFWRTLKSKVILKQEEDVINTWFPDLVSTEELFSLLVILNESNKIDSTNIYCNVPGVRHLEEIKKGFVTNRHLETSKNNFKRLELASNFEDYFREDGKNVFIKEELLKNIHFLNSNLYTSLPSVDMSLVIYRNRMLYFNQKLQCVTEKKIHEKIKKGGFIALGIKERISSCNEELFEMFDLSEKIYTV